MILSASVTPYRCATMFNCLLAVIPLGIIWYPSKPPVQTIYTKVKQYKSRQVDLIHRNFWDSIAAISTCFTLDPRHSFARDTFINGNIIDVISTRAWGSFGTVVFSVKKGLSQSCLVPDAERPPTTHRTFLSGRPHVCGLSRGSGPAVYTAPPQSIARVRVRPAPS
jgi:hypothetical protein